MGLEYFKCPDGIEVKIPDCLKEGGCRMSERCAARPILKAMAASDRPWKNNPSTTQLIKGTMAAFLEIMHPYSQTPDKMAFALQGNSGHYALEKHGDDTSQAELDFSDEKGSIRPDLIERENGKNILIDYKLGGSFAVSKALGIYFEDVAVIDPVTKKQAVYKSGPKKGKLKTKKERKIDPRLSDVRDWALQLNNYRIRLEAECVQDPVSGKIFRRDNKEKPEGCIKLKIDRIKVQAVVRDGGTMAAMTRGVERNIYYIDIPKVPDQEIKDYFKRKRDDLLLAVQQGHWETPCNDIERWNDRKCTDFCPVNKHCTYWIQKYSKNANVEGMADADMSLLNDDGSPKEE